MRKVPKAAAAAAALLKWDDVGRAALLEPLITCRESLVAPGVLEQLASNLRFRAALRMCRLDPSERFLDRMIEVLGGSRRLAP